MKAFYLQQAQEITPIFGAASLQEAQEWAGTGIVIETDEQVLMNPHTGSVGFESDWEEKEGLIVVRWCMNSEGWVEE